VQVSRTLYVEHGNNFHRRTRKAKLDRTQHITTIPGLIGINGNNALVRTLLNGSDSTNKLQAGQYVEAGIEAMRFRLALCDPCYSVCVPLIAATRPVPRWRASQLQNNHPLSYSAIASVIRAHRLPRGVVGAKIRLKRQVGHSPAQEPADRS